jgi:DNA-binding NarL/FixJ family response regulator
MTGLRVVLAEDDVLLRESLASLLQHSGFEVVGQAGDGPGLLEQVRRVAPDLVVAESARKRPRPRSWSCPPTPTWSTPWGC